MNCHDIIKDYLQKNGHDGLCLPDFDCGCGLNDFAPCGDGPTPQCQPAKARPWRVSDGLDVGEPGSIVYVTTEEGAKLVS